MKAATRTHLSCVPGHVSQLLPIPITMDTLELRLEEILMLEEDANDAYKMFAHVIICSMQKAITLTDYIFHHYSMYKSR